MVAIPGNVDATATCFELAPDNTVSPNDPDSDPDLAPVTAADCGPLDLLVVDTRFDNSIPSNRFRFITPIIGDLLGSPSISGQAQVVVQ
jgi:hypothetical protein